MPIEVDCPNGHHLKIKDKYAGQTGLCPHCQSRVYVPIPAAVSEDDIVNWMGPPPASDDLPVHQESSHLDSEGGGSSLLGSSVLRRGMKTCKKCRKSVPRTYDLCPHCHTYFTDLTEVARRMVAPCPVCHQELELGAQWCAHCGADLQMH